MIQVTLYKILGVEGYLYVVSPTVQVFCFLQKACGGNREFYETHKIEVGEWTKQQNLCLGKYANVTVSKLYKQTVESNK